MSVVYKLSGTESTFRWFLPLSSIYGPIFRSANHISLVAVDLQTSDRKEQTDQKLYLYIEGAVTGYVESRPYTFILPQDIRNDGNSPGVRFMIPSTPHLTVALFTPSSPSFSPSQVITGPWSVSLRFYYYNTSVGLMKYKNSVGVSLLTGLLIGLFMRK